MDNFYDKVAKKFGGYAFSNSKPKYTTKYSNGVPEADFKEKLLEIASSHSVALDIGCGDGKFAFEIATHFSRITGLDSSKGLIDIAKKKKQELKNENIIFILGNASKTPFDDNSFDIIFNRRGPGFYAEYYRLLKLGGYYIEIGIGEKDTMQLKKTFGRGQGFGNWKSSRLKTDKLVFEKLGFKPVSLKDYEYIEYYPSESEFELFLEGVPIFEDFDSAHDRKYLEKYYGIYKKGEKIVLDRHRVVYLIQK